MRKILIMFFCTLTVLTYGQKNKNIEPNFDMADFQKKFEVVQWLYKYDHIAWWTSDSVMKQDKNEIKRLGHEWFCFKDNNTWHAVYGKYENGIFDLVFHFLVDTNGQVKRTYDKVDTLLLNSYSRALQTANSQLTALRDTVRIRFNQFIRQNEDKTFSIWILPAMQPNGTAIYGGEFIYTIDQSGNKILKDDSYSQGNFWGYDIRKKNKEILLNYRDIEKPTLGAIFFVWYYKEYFENIIIDTSKSRSMVIKKEDKSYFWLHIEKKSKRKKKDK